MTNKEGISKYKKDKARKLAVYIIKVRNFQEVDKLELVRQEREKQIRLVESFLVNELDRHKILILEIASRILLCYNGKTVSKNSSQSILRIAIFKRSNSL